VALGSLILELKASVSLAIIPMPLEGLLLLVLFIRADALLLGEALDRTGVVLKIESIFLSVRRERPLGESVEVFKSYSLFSKTFLFELRAIAARKAFSGINCIGSSCSELTSLISKVAFYSLTSNLILLL
jgi:hypothetical protein